MSPETARLVIYAIAGVGFVVWLAALQFVVLSARKSKSENPSSLEPNEPVPDNWVVGSAEVAGQPRVLAKRAAALLAKQGGGALVPVKILECTEERLVFEGLNSDARNGLQVAAFGRGELRFLSEGKDRTRIDYAVEAAQRGWLLLLAKLFLILGLLVLVGGAWVLVTFVAPSPNPELRWQAIQMVQAIHFLWPPFLFVWLYRRNLRGVRTTFEALTNNLPFTE